MALKPNAKSLPVAPAQQVAHRFGLIIVLLLACILVVVPSAVNQVVDRINKAANLGLPRLPDKGFNLGLDLQGGAHLIYQADTSHVPDADRPNSVEGVRDVIERRVRGGLGVAEPLVQTTKVGNDYRVIVELPGITDVNQAIKLIGETPILEFKEKNNSPPRDLTAAETKELNDFNKVAEKKLQQAQAALRKGTAFTDTAKQFSEDEASRDKGGDLGFITEQLYPELYQWAKTHKDGEVSSPFVKSFKGLNIVKRIAEKQGEKTVSASHILICYKGIETCQDAKYTKDEARVEIERIKKLVTAKNFADLAKQFSTEPGAAQSGGSLGSLKKGAMVAAFEDAAFALPSGSISDVVETQFGFHLIFKEKESFLAEYNVARIQVNTKDKTDIVPPADPWKSTGLTGKQLKRAEVTQDSRTGLIQVSLNFNEEGTKLFAEITGRNVGKPVAVFLDGEPISIPRVDTEITSGSAVISGGFTLAEAKLLATRLNSGALPVPVELISQQTVDATLGAESLGQSYRAGIIGLLLVMLFMILYYRLPGLLSVFSLLFYSVLSLAIFKLIGVTLTLAGIAGFILSIGMAVDANILVFERLKEELRLGKGLQLAMEESFLRSWPSIRDSHITALISCIFLIWFGVGFIQGFAVVLAMGTLINLFTAVSVTRTIMRFVFVRLKDRSSFLFLGSSSK